MTVSYKRDGSVHVTRDEPEHGEPQGETVVIPKGEGQAAQIAAFFAAGINKREAVIPEDVPRLFTEAEVKALIAEAVEK